MDKFLNNIFNQKLTRIWIVSYLCILALPIILGIVSYIHTLKVLSENMESTNLRLLNNAKTYVDSVLGNITNASSSLQKNKTILSLTDNLTNGDIDNPDAYSYTEKESIWSAHNVLSGYIANKYIYFPQKNLIYHNNSTLQPHYLYLALYAYNGEVSEDEWKENILDCPNSGFVQIKGISEHPKIFHISPVYSSGKIIYSTIVELNWTALCKDAAGDYSSNFFMNSYNYSTFYSNMDPQSVEAIRKTTHSALSYNTTTVKGKKFIVLKTISSNGNWFYGFSMPASDYYNIIIRPIIFSVVMYLITILLSAAIILYTVYKNSIPINRIVRTLKTKDNMDGDIYDTYSYIENKIASIMKDNNLYFERLDKQTNTFKNVILSNLLTDKNKNKSTVANQFELLGINVNYDTFYTIAFSYDDLSELFFDDAQPLEKAKKHEYAQFIISNVFSETLNSIFNATGVIVSNTNIFLINTDISDYEEFTQKLFTVMEANISFIRQQFNFNVYTAVSSTPAAIDSLNDSYIEAIIAMQYALASKKPIVCYNEIPDEYIHNISIPNSLETAIVDCIENGDYVSCKKIVYKAIYQFQTNKKITFETTRIFAYNLLTIIFNSLLNNADYNTREFISKTDLATIFEDDHSPSNLLLHATTIIDNCFSMFEKDNEPLHYSKDNLYQNLKKYIDEHYDNPELHSVSLGDTFNINPSYMSTQFKKEFGITITAYITTVRIENAKRLLLTTNLTTEQISTQVGFSNYRTFLRVFKKIENLTPKEFKQLNAST